MNQIKVILKFLIKYFEEILCLIILSSMIIVTAEQIVFRYLLANPLPWSEELLGYLLVWFGLFGAVVAAKRKAHTIVDLLITRVGYNTRKILFIISTIFISIMLWILIISGYIVAVNTNYPTVTLPFNWTVVYITVPISALLMFVRIIEILFTRRERNHL